jgi:hypothetical protein
VVALDPELQDAATEEPELHAVLHDDAQVAEGERLERRDGTRGVGCATPALGVPDAAEPLSRQHAERVEHTLPVLLLGQPVGDAQRGIGEKRSDP